ncbi:MAG: endopeptidase La [Planctomycetes bacterium]|nr:endopeptidase La [Planctomycetota bacterium]
MINELPTNPLPDPSELSEVEQVEIPAELPVLALRGALLYPYMVLPIQVGRGKSLALVDDAAVGPRLFAVAAQRDEKVEDPRPGDLFGTGTACRILRLMKLPDGSFRLLVQGLRRVRFEEFTTEDPYLRARVSALEERGADSLRVEALRNSARDLFRELVGASPSLPDELASAADGLDDPARLADFVAANLPVPVADRQRVLEALDVEQRLTVVTELLGRETKVAEIQQEIQKKVAESVGQRNREAILREQMRAIQTELGEEDARKEETEALRRRIAEAKMPPEAERAATKELDRLARMHPSAAEYTVARTYLDQMLSVPWAVETEDRFDVAQAAGILDEDHHGLSKVKDRILEFLAVMKLKRDLKGPILCLVGPPGVGKTSLGRSVARAMGRKFVRISLGGVRDEAEIRGHRRTYVGAMPGRIVAALSKAGTRNPIFMLDEVDKLGADYRGDPSSALLEVLDPAQNNTFNDHYLEVDLDLSRVLFIATANVLETIPPPLRDRMEIIALPGYTLEEKTEIAKRHLMPQQLEAHGLVPAGLSITDEALAALAHEYTREAGVRNLEREIGSLCRKVARRVAEGDPGPFRIDVEDLRGYLGPPRYWSELAEGGAVPGVVTGLVWTPVGGEILFIEATKMPGKRGLTLTGSLGDVMKESAQAAMSFVRANAATLGIEPEEFEKHDVHLHVPAGAIPKDGPSAGAAIALALASLFTGRPVPPTIALTGEITLRGKVMPVGGIREKVLGALRAGIETVILPARNEKDLEEIPPASRAKLRFVFVSTMSDVLIHALPQAEAVAG